MRRFRILQGSIASIKITIKGNIFLDFCYCPAKIFIYSEKFIPYKFIQLLLYKEKQEERGTKDKAKI